MTQDELRRRIPRDESGHVHNPRMKELDTLLCKFRYTPRELDYFDMEISLYYKKQEEKYAAKRLARTLGKGGPAA